MNHAEGTDRYVLGMNVADDGFSFTSSIETALISAETEIRSLEETIKSVESLRPNCDKLDYALAASSGALCGLIDIFLVGKPGESPIGDITDKWFANRTSDFAKLCGWDGKGDNPLASAISFLEKKFSIPYDQRGAGDAASFIFDLNPTNHHFKSLGHNPTVLGLFFSILGQHRIMGEIGCCMHPTSQKRYDEVEFFSRRQTESGQQAPLVSQIQVCRDWRTNCVNLRCQIE